MKLLLAILLTLCGSAHATTYYLDDAANGGSDSNNGLSTGAPWLTPNHAVNCGDVIQAAARTDYVATNFDTGEWGVVTCSAGNNVAWLKCVTFDGCKISTSTAPGMYIDENYWGVQGWEVTSTYTSFGICFLVAPRYATPVQIHHIVLANDIANGCMLGGLATNTFGSIGVDYLAIVGSIAYNASQGSGACTSGVTIYEPSNSDTLPGTHIYVAGNYLFGNIDPNPCNGGAPTDGEGIIFDTFNQYSYTGQAVIENNISVWNGGAGIDVTKSTSGACVYVKRNTTFGNLIAVETYTGELNLYTASCTETGKNIFDSTQATSNYYGVAVGVVGPTIHVYSDRINAPTSGQYTFTDGSAGFSFGPNNTNGDPGFANPVSPSAPSCGSFASVPACMATVIANYKSSAVPAYGYQVPTTSTTGVDPLFPQWLCNVNLPAGLVQEGCGIGSQTLGAMIQGGTQQ